MLSDECFCVVRRVFLCCQASVSVLSDECFCVVRRVFQCCLTSVSVLSDKCFCVMRQVFLCCQTPKTGKGGGEVRPGATEGAQT